MHYIKCLTCTIKFHVYGRVIFTALLKNVEVVEKELFKDDDAFEPLLTRLRNCLGSHPYTIDPVPMIDFYSIRHTYNKREL
jgi:hypothetical protein